MIKKTGRYHVIVINLLVALALTLLVNFSYFVTGNEMRGHRPPPFFTVEPSFVIFRLFYFYVMVALLVMLNTVKGLSIWRKIFVSLLIAVVFYLFVPTLNFKGHWSLPSFMGRLYNPLQIMKVSFILVVSVLYGVIFQLLYQKQHISIENEKLKNENLQTRYNMLANQISPHFLFNSLNSLSMLVREKSNEKALLYIDRLADTFRYMLRSGQGELTTLAEELRFTEAYIYLLTIRYENKLFCDIRIEECYMHWRLPVLSLQPLIENAVKHNSITLTKPLHIEIYTDQDKLYVSNPLIPKLEPTTGTGIGLKNLASRYELLTSREVEITATDGAFRVGLPLLDPESSEK